MDSTLLIIVDEKPEAEDTAANTIFRETIDAALGIAAFGIEVSLWFCGEGVCCLQKSAQFNIIEALKYYEIEAVYASKDDLLNYKPNYQKLDLELIPLEPVQFATLLKKQQTVLRMC